jgi:aspartate/methionine/tyrosine aminotransferase
MLDSGTSDTQCSTTSFSWKPTRNPGPASHSSSRAARCCLKPTDGYVQERRDFLHQALSDIAGVRLPNPDGAFYMMLDVSAFFGPHAQASGFGAVPDADALCRCTFETVIHANPTVQCV